MPLCAWPNHFITHTMDRIKKYLRLLGLALLVILACSGLGIAAAIFPNQRDKQLLPEIKTEMVEDRKEEDDGEMKDVE